MKGFLSAVGPLIMIGALLYFNGAFGDRPGSSALGDMWGFIGEKLQAGSEVAEKAFLPPKSGADATCNDLTDEVGRASWKNNFSGQKVNEVLKVYNVYPTYRTDRKLECTFTVRTSAEGHAEMFASMEWDHEGDIFNYFGEPYSVSNFPPPTNEVEEAFSEAMGLHRKAVDMGPGPSRNLKYSGAIEAYIKVIELDPQGKYSAVSYHHKGRLLHALGRDDKAVDSYTKAIELVRTSYWYSDVFTFWWRGLSYYRLGKYELALPDFNQAILRKPKAVNYEWKCSTLIQLERYEEAIVNCTQAIDLDPSFRNAYVSRGSAYISLGNRAKGEADQKKAEELDY